MIYTVFQRDSASGAFLRNAASGCFNAGGVSSPNLAVKRLINIKQWPGFQVCEQIGVYRLQVDPSGITDLTANFGWTSSPSSNVTLTSLRKRYSVRTTTYAASATNSIGYTSTDTFSGPPYGLWPSNDGNMPDTIWMNPDGSLTAIGAMGSDSSAPFMFPTVYGGTGATFGGGCSVTYNFTSIVGEAHTMTGDSGDPFPPPPGSPPPTFALSETISVAFSEETYFTVMLAIACDRIMARTDWPVFTTDDYGVAGVVERWNEWGSVGDISAADGAIQSHVDPGTGTPWGFPWFFYNPALDPASTYQALVSFWMYPVDDDTAGPASAWLTNIDPVLACRTRFRAGTDLTYWIGHALIRYAPGAAGGPTPSPLDVTTHTAETVVAAGTVLDIPFPTERDFPVATTGEQCRGVMLFVIVNETRAAWSARTGIPVS